MVTGVLDLWSVVEYGYPAPDRAVAVSPTDCIRQVENAGKPNELRGGLVAAAPATA